MFNLFPIPHFSWNMPFCGDVKDISPITSWFSPQYSFNIAGNAEVEKKVVTEVASYGRQLGKLTQAVLEIADGKPGEGVEALRAMAEEIAAIKHQALCDTIEADIARLKTQNRVAYQALLKRLGAAE